MRCSPVPACRPVCAVQARNLRLLERADLGACKVLVADGASNRVDPDLSVPSNDAGVYYMPRFSEVSRNMWDVQVLCCVNG